MIKVTIPKLGLPPTALSANVSKSMKGNKANNTRPEMQLRQALRGAGLAGYRLAWSKVPGHPDISYPGRQVAIFVHGCYWHRCPYCNLPMPKHNAEFWQRKFIRNKERDYRKTQELEALGWKVIVIWECQVNKDLDICIEKIRGTLDFSYNSKC